jgi:hypothetical protein
VKRIILIKSCQKFFARRDACESTWVGELRGQGIDAYFVEGNHLQTQLVAGTIEMNCEDDYDSNSFKVRDAIKFLLANAEFDTLFVADDNSFIHPARWLAHEPGGEFEGLQTKKVPWCHGGAGFYLSRRCCELYVAGVTKRCSWDDQLATEIMTRNRIKMVNRPDLYAQWDERVGAGNSLITCHNVSPHEMTTLFEATRSL